MSSKDDVTSSEGHREIRVEGNYFEYVAGNVYTGTIVIQRDGREIQLPLQRPPRPEFFTGRNQELAQLLQDLQPGHVVTLCGPGGIGKTALAAEAIWRLADEEQLLVRFPDGIIFHSFYGRPDVTLALEHIATSYGADPRPTPELAALQVLAGKRALLFLDGTEEASDLRAVLNIRGECGVIVTSRSRRDAVAARQDVTPLPTDDAVKLLRAWGKDQVMDETAVHQICDGVGGLPLAVRLVGRYLNETGETAAEYMDWLQDQPLEALHQGEHREESVNVLLKRSLEQVSDTARQVLAVCGVLALVSFSKEVLAAALPDVELRRPLNELLSYGLLLRSGERYEVSHALIHTYARKRLQPDESVLNRLAAYYTGFAREQSQHGVEGYARLDAERAHIMQVIEACKERQQWQAVTDLVWAVDSYLNMRGYWTDRQTALEIGMEAARQLRHRRNEEAFLIKIGLTCHDLGQVEQAIGFYEHALIICREIGHREDEGNALGNLGNIYRDLGQVEQAIKYYDQALTIARDIGHHQREGTHLGNLGNAYRDLGQVEQAIKYYAQALTLARDIDDRESEEIWLGNLGNAYLALRQVKQAFEYYKQALSIARDIGHRQNEGTWLGNLGISYQALGQMDKAIEYYKQALAIHRETGFRRGEGGVLGNLGGAYLVLKQVEQAIEYYEQALTITREIGHRQGEGGHLSNLGLAYHALGQVEQAREYLQQALSIFEEIKSPIAEEVRKWLAELEATGEESTE